MQIWCNEAQERVLAIAAEGLAAFRALCERERCPYALIGVATGGDAQLIVSDRQFDNRPVDLPMSVLFGKPPRMQRDVTRERRSRPGRWT